MIYLQIPLLFVQFDRMNHFYSKRHLPIHHIILFTVFLICFFPSAAYSCSVVDALDIIQLCSVDDPGLTVTAQTDLRLSTDETDQDDHCMLGNCIRQAARSLRLSPTPPLRSLAPSSSSSSYSATSRAFPTGYTLASTPNSKQASTMISSSSPSSSHLPAETPRNEQQQQQQQVNAENEATTKNNNNNNQKLALPPVPENNSEAQKLDVSEQTDTTVSLDHLGPIVVNQDGTMSRISNWDKMTEVERKNTLRIIGKRNKQRLEALKAAGVS